MATTAVSPTGLRAAAHAIILDGDEGTSAATRTAGALWSDTLVETFLAHRQELMSLCTGNPPSPEAEKRLLQLCRDSVGITAAEIQLIKSALML
ncbi:MAG TPA: hypothetical protein VLE72_03550 [Candidatus Saccharimonadales bacterium]|nr:hypothetical protein [Candidatus Saccharimonadales bacterium]